jgi:glycosyltransferase involved in cell wall biosynthesis
MKIIHILHHSHPNYNSEVKFWKEDWHARVAYQTLKMTDKYEIECWRPEKKADKTIIGQEDGITYKIFPSYYSRFGDYSIHLLRELRKESLKNEILIHLHGIHFLLPRIIANNFNDVPIVGQQHGEATALARYHYHLKNGKKLAQMYYILNHIYEKKSLNNVDKFFVLTTYEKEYLSKIVDENKIEVQTMGVDFNLYKPIDKELAREQLNLPKNKKIILYVGRFDTEKSVHLIIDAFEKLKNKYDLELVLIGGAKEDILYEKAKICGAKVITRIPSEYLIPYYSAADAYICYLSTNLWGGIGIAPVEAMACNLPVVSNTLEYFPNNEGKFVGKIPNDENDLVSCLEDIIKNSKNYQNCRTLSMKYYNWEEIIQNTVRVYDELFEMYYKKDCK